MNDDGCGYSRVAGSDVAKILLFATLFGLGAMALGRFMKRRHPRTAADLAPIPEQVLSEAEVSEPEYPPPSMANFI